MIRVRHITGVAGLATTIIIISHVSIITGTTTASIAVLAFPNAADGRVIRSIVHEFIIIA